VKLDSASTHNAASASRRSPSPEVKTPDHTTSRSHELPPGPPPARRATPSSASGDFCRPRSPSPAAAPAAYLTTSMPEIWLRIANALPPGPDVLRLSETCRSIHSALAPILPQHRPSALTLARIRYKYEQLEVPADRISYLQTPYAQSLDGLQALDEHLSLVLELQRPKPP
jgi:hypothetical protein